MGKQTMCQMLKTYHIMHYWQALRYYADKPCLKMYREQNRTKKEKKRKNAATLTLTIMLLPAYKFLYLIKLP